jgi:hypothetical protein
MTALTQGPIGFLAGAIREAVRQGLWTPEVDARWRGETTAGALAIAQALHLQHFYPQLERALALSEQVSGFGLYAETSGSLNDAAKLLPASTIFDWSKKGTEALMPWLLGSTLFCVEDQAFRMRRKPYAPCRIDVYRHFSESPEPPADALRQFIAHIPDYQKAQRQAECIAKIADFHEFRWNALPHFLDMDILTPVLLHRVLFWHGDRRPVPVDAKNTLSAWLDILEQSPQFRLLEISDLRLAEILPECEHPEDRRALLQVTERPNLSAEEIMEIIIEPNQAGAHDSELYGHPLPLYSWVKTPATIALENGMIGLTLIAVGLSTRKIPLQPASEPRLRAWTRRLARDHFDQQRVMEWLGTHHAVDDTIKAERDKWIYTQFFPTVNRIIKIEKKIVISQDRSEQEALREESMDYLDNIIEGW